jgi:hypothetical protein
LRIERIHQSVATVANTLRDGQIIKSTATMAGCCTDLEMPNEELPAAYLRGIELFNAGEFFACHEALEPLWLAARGEERAFLHALIQAAAALHHWQRGNLKGAASVFARAKQGLATMPARMMGIQTGQLTRELETFFSAVFASQSNRLQLPKIQLEPEQKTVQRFFPEEG